MAEGPATAHEVIELLERARDVYGRLDPVAVALGEVPPVFDAVAELERLAGGAVLRMAARYEEAGAWKRNGARSPEDDIARKTGTGTSRARRKLSTSKRLHNQPRTDDAIRRGQVSTDQADEISEGAGRFESVEAYTADVIKDLLLSDAFLTLVFRKGTDICHVTHLGRQVTAAQRTALEARGCRCERCGSTYLLDIDHNEGWALTHDTRTEDLSWACWHCHDIKTRHNLRFVGEPGAKRLVRRDGTDWDPPPEDGPPRPGSPPPGTSATADAVQPDLFTLAD